MKVIFLQDVDNIGKKYDVKIVKNGYARNFLIPKGLAKPATESGLLVLEQLKKAEMEGIEQGLVNTQKAASELDGQEIEFLVKTGEEDQLFESIGRLKIVKKLKEIGFEIKKDQIALDKPIKEIGEFPIKINLDHHLEAKISVIVEPEKEQEKEEDL